MRSEFNVSALFWLPLGFKIDPIFIPHSGARYTPVTGFDTQGDGNEGNDRAILDGRVASRNSLRQSAFYDLDVRVARGITLPGEGHYLDMFMDVFNLTGAQNLNFGRMGSACLERRPCRCLQPDSRCLRRTQRTLAARESFSSPHG